MYMKIVLLKSTSGTIAGRKGDYSVKMNTAYSRRLLGHLTEGDYCHACAQNCIGCRKKYNLDLSERITGVYSFPAVLPVMIDDPESYLPDSIAPHDILIGVSVHEEILVSFIRKFPIARGIILPIEESDWISPYAKKTIADICAEKGIEVAFPKPFCSFNPGGGILYEFQQETRIGKPDIAFVVENGGIVDARVRCSAPCGATYYVAKNLVGRTIDENLIYRIDSLLSSYPCTAGREVDREFNDSITHRAVQIQRDILKDIHVAHPNKVFRH
jgi:hypothetical protein